MKRGFVVHLFGMTAFGLALLTSCHSRQPSANSLDAMDDQLMNDTGAAETAANDRVAGGITVDTHSLVSRRRARWRGTEPDHGRPRDKHGCFDHLHYAAGWAAKLPAQIPMHPEASLQDAAGRDGNCLVRIVSFTVRTDRATLLGWYRDKARAAGYSIERDDKDADWILAGERGRSVYSLIFAPTAAGVTSVDYIWARPQTATRG